METPAIGTLELDDGTSQFTELGLRTSTILRTIMEQFSTKEVLRISFVNKQWNFEARSVLKVRGSLSARITSLDPCKSLADLASHFQQMQVVPCSGLKFWLSHDKNSRSFNEPLGPSFKILLDRLPCKYLEVCFFYGIGDFEDSQGLVLVQKTLEIFHEFLEEVRLHFVWKVEKELLEQLFQRWKFPHLKTLKIKENSDDKSLTNFLKSLVPRAPNLLELNIADGIHFQENVLEGSSAVLVPFSEFDPLDERLCESLIRSLRAETIEIRTHGKFELEAELLKRVVPMALQASRGALKTLRMDLLFAVPLMCYGICLKNVTKLDITMSRDSLAFMSSIVEKLLKRFDFTRIFPKLEHVKIVTHYRYMFAFTWEHIHSFVEQGNAVLKKTFEPDRAVNIKRLTLTESIWDSALPFWAKMFPQVKTLSVHTGVAALSPLKHLWQHFENLEELSVISCHFGLMMTLNVDSVFCGIFPEEVAELSEKDDEYLKAVNIVPVMPSITSMKGLKTVSIDFKVTDMKLEPTFLFSKVTILTAFARLPGLTVTVI